MVTNPRKIIVVGAGTSGLSAAYRLKQAGHRVKLIERTDRVGGRVQTVATQGYLIDTGATAMTSAYDAYLDLAEELGLRAEVKPASSYIGIVRDNRVFEMDMRHPLRSGLFTRLLSLRAKLNLSQLFRDVAAAKSKGLLDYNDLSKAAPLDNESAADYARRRFNPEVNDYFCDPVIRTMLIANGDKISKVELFSGVANVMNAEMCGLTGGLQRFAKTLAQGIDIEYESSATAVRHHGEGVEVAWHGKRGEVVEQADACVVACLLPTATDICADYRDLLQPLNQRLRYTKAITVAIGFKRLPNARAMVVQVPNCEHDAIALLFMDHNKVADRAPPGHGLINAHFEAGASEKLWDESDETLVETTLQYIYRLFPELRDCIDMSHVTRWSHALPLTSVGVYQAIAELNAKIDPGARVQFAADYMASAGQNTAVSFGLRAANNLIKRWE